MKVIKSDGRYNFHREGFTTIIQFNMRIRPQRDQFFQLQSAVRELYGEPRFIDSDTGRWKTNENYRTQMMSDRKHRRIYLRSESEVTILLLKVS